MNFKVETDSLRTARDRLQALAADVDAADSYKATHLNITGVDNGVFFVHIDNVNSDVVARLNDVLSRLKGILDDSGLELGAAASWYDQTDDSTERQMDAQIVREAPLATDEQFADDPDFEDTVPEDPGDYTPSEEDDGVIMAPGPPGYLDQPENPVV